MFRPECKIPKGIIDRVVLAFIKKRERAPGSTISTSNGHAGSSWRAGKCQNHLAALQPGLDAVLRPGQAPSLGASAVPGVNVAPSPRDGLWAWGSVPVPPSLHLHPKLLLHRRPLRRGQGDGRESQLCVWLFQDPQGRPWDEEPPQGARSLSCPFLPGIPTLPALQLSHCFRYQDLSLCSLCICFGKINELLSDHNYKYNFNICSLFRKRLQVPCHLL